MISPKVKIFGIYPFLIEPLLIVSPTICETDTDGDAWVSLEVLPSMVLNNDFDRGEAWSYLRNRIRQMD